MTNEFDAIGYAQRLESTGVSRDQAEAHAQALTEVIDKNTSKDDLLRVETNLRHEILEREERLVLRIELVRTELSPKIDAVKTELSAKIDVVDAKIDAVKTELSANIDAVKTELNAKIDLVNAKIDAVKTELNAKIDRMKTELDATINDLKAELKIVKNELVLHRWLFTILIGLNLTILFKLIFP